MSRRPTTKRRGVNRRTTRRQPKAPSRQLGGAVARVLPWFFGALVLVGVGMGLRFGWQSLRDTERFRVQSIEVLGSSRLQWAELAAYTGIHVGDPILAVDLDAAALGLRRHPWIASATVRRRLPSHLTLAVREHQAQMLVALDDVYIANGEGALFKRLSAADNVVLPVLTGVTRAVTVEAPETTTSVIRDAIALAAVFAEGGVRGAVGGLEELRWDAVLGWSAVTDRGGPARLRLHLGLDPVTRLDLGIQAVQRLRELERAPTVLWLDGPRKAGRVRVQVGFEALPHRGAERLAPGAEARSAESFLQKEPPTGSSGLSLNRIAKVGD